jgi:DNA-binding NtrC family response regulator
VTKETSKKKPLIYLVDDQPMLLDLAEVSLQAEGYALKKFQHPEAALESFRKAKTKPALLITDYAMGKMNGLELMEKCKQLHPNLKTILMSGTTGAEIVLESAVKVDRFLGKPYQPANLSELVRRVLADVPE